MHLKVAPVDGILFHLQVCARVATFVLLDLSPLVGLVGQLAYLAPGFARKVVGTMKVVNVATHEPDRPELVLLVPGILDILNPDPHARVGNDLVGAQALEGLIQVLPQATGCSR